MLIGLGHQARVGKDTVADILVHEHGFKRIGFADALKHLVLELNPIVGSYGSRLAELVRDLGWDMTKVMYPESRVFLQDVGVGCRNTFGENCWVDVVRSQMHRGSFMIEIVGDWVISDLRFPNEAEYVTGNEGFCVKVHRPGIEAVNDHVSETALAGYPWDFVLENDGLLEDLHAKVTFMVVALQEKIDQKIAEEAARKAAKVVQPVPTPTLPVAATPPANPYAAAFLGMYTNPF